MPTDFKQCVIKRIFSVNLSQRFNTFDVNKIFKYVLHVNHYLRCLCISCICPGEHERFSAEQGSISLEQVKIGLSASD